MRRRVPFPLVVAFLALVATSAACGNGTAPELEVGNPDAEADYEYVIPAGTSARIADGEVVDLMPQRLEVTVGESIRIRNEDVAGASVGIFYVGAGETVRMKFSTPGELTGECEVSASGEFTILVTEA